MSRRSRAEAMDDVPSPSDGEYIDLPNLSHITDPGPLVTTLLYKQDTHRSKRIWETSSTSLLVVRHRGHWVADQRILPYVIRAGFGPWYYMQNYEVDWSFMTALVERWRSETHTFHLRHGEMTITLQDVSVLTGLPIEGRAVITNHGVDEAMCMSLLGVVPPTGRRDSSVRRTWFRNNMKEIPEDATDEVIQRYARAYILVMLGSSVFPDSSGSDVSLHYLPLLADLDGISEYSWGSAALAFLYRSMCNACESSHTQLSGCAILVQLWAWEHLIIGRPRTLAIPAPPPGSDVDPMRLPALGYKWNVPKSWMQTSHCVLMLYRDLLDRQEPNDVIWTPYTEEVLATLNPICVVGRDCWTAEVPLFCFNIAEWHYPSRVLRQFEWRQPEPALPPQSHRVMHMSKRRTSEPLDAEMQVHMNLWDNRVDHIITGDPDTDGSYLEAYYSWYNTVTRKRIQPPLDTSAPYRPSTFQLNSLVASLVRTCKVTSGVFLKTTDNDSKRALHDLFHSTRADLLRIGEGLALDVNPAQIHLNDDTDDEVDLPDDNFEVGGPSQVTQVESQMTQIRRLGSRARRPPSRFTPGS
ncbi:unnamed protein product [Rhodiola kirilowii]